MDVRCENCRTIYELDDARVGDGGLTVKCQECGNLFKVRRRQETTLLVSPVADADADAARDEPVLQAAKMSPTPAMPGQHAPKPGAKPDVKTDVKPDVKTDETTAAIRARRGPDVVGTEQPREVGWMLRSHATQEVVRFRELTTLQQWIVERKVAREDEISRGGDSWKPLGGIAELASFFHVVEQAASVAHATQPGLAVLRANQVGGLDKNQLGRLNTNIIRNYPEAPAKLDAQEEQEDGRAFVDELDAAKTTPANAQPKRRALLFMTIFLLIGAAGAATFVLRHHAPPKDTRDADAQQALDRGHKALVLDTDDGYRQAIALLDRVVEESDPNAQLDARVELAEAHVLWATLLGEDAHDLEHTGTLASAAHTMRAEAQAHIERARRILEEPTGAEAAASTRLSLAFADLLRAEGAPADAVTRYLDRARTGPPDPSLPIVEGELALRDGSTQAAAQRFATAVTTPNSEVARAHFRLAQLASKEGRTADLQRECDALFAISSKHERGHALCAQPSSAVADASTTPSVPDAAIALAKSSTLAPSTPSGGTADYKTLVHEADHLVETNHAPQAAKLYERALELDSRGVAALVGLGNCDLAGERLMQAADLFGTALAIDPSEGDAMLGLAKSYKIRGRTAQAAELYKKYLDAHATGDKAQLAQKALRELDTATANDTAAASDHVTVKSQATEDAPAPKEPKEHDDKDALPKLPSQEPAP